MTDDKMEKDFAAFRWGELELDVFNATLGFAALLGERHPEQEFCVEIARNLNNPNTLIRIVNESHEGYRTIYPTPLTFFQSQGVYVFDNLSEVNREYIGYLTDKVPQLKDVLSFA